MSAPTIRAATPADQPLLTALGRQTYVEHFADLWTPMALEAWLEGQFGATALAADLASRTVRYDLLFVDDGPVGYAKTRGDRPVETLEALRGLELQKIYFLRSATGRGLGSILLEHVLARADAEGAPLVWLDVLKSNQGGRRLYERHGFRVVGASNSLDANAALEFWVMVRERPR